MKFALKITTKLAILYWLLFGEVCPENSSEIPAKPADFSANLSLKIPWNWNFSFGTCQKPWQVQIHVQTNILQKKYQGWQIPLGWRQTSWLFIYKREQTLLAVCVGHEFGASRLQFQSSSRMAMLPPLLLRGSLHQSSLYLVQLSAFWKRVLTIIEKFQGVIRIIITAHNKVWIRYCIGWKQQ